MTARLPVIYMRRSKVDAGNPGAISQEVQLGKATKLASLDDGDPPVVLQDWGRSGRGSKLHLRTAYAELLALITADRVSTLYSYNLSRLGRSAADVLSLAKLCAEHGTVVKCVDGFSPDATSATGRMVTGILATVAEWQAELQAESTADGLAAYRARNVANGLAANEGLGRKKYGDVDGEDTGVLLAAFQAAGSYSGAAKLLNANGQATRLGRRWHAATIRRILRRAAPGSVPMGSLRGSPAAGKDYRFRGLLLCPCGATLTCRTTAWGQSYLCPRALVDRSHGKPYQTSERPILEWSRKEAEKAYGYARVVQTSEGDGGSAALLADVDARRLRWAEAFAAGAIDRVTLDAKLSALSHEAEAVEVRNRLRTSITPDVNWTAAPGEVNASLRNLWSAIRLGEDMRPVLAEWRPGAKGLGA